MAAALTEIAGASDVVERGFVVYSNAAKESMLGVPASTLKRHGAVSAETAIAMAAGALQNSQADISVAITGIAGPGGGTKQKPVGLVHFAAAEPRRQASRSAAGCLAKSAGAACVSARSRKRSNFWNFWRSERSTLRPYPQIQP